MKNFNFKLAFASLSLLGSLILFVFSQTHNLFVMFGCFCLSLALVLFALDRQEKTTKSIIATNKDIESGNVTDMAELAALEDLKRKVVKKNKRLQVSLYVGAVLFVVLGIFVVI